jgi:hypothetical protein
MVQAPDQSEMQPPPAAAPPTQDGQGYVPRSWRERQAPTAVRLPVSAVVPASFFVGHWGQVSFNNENDLAKMTQVARTYCNLPVTIALNTPTTFKMYVATELKEVQVFEQSGSLYIIPTEQLSDGIIRGARELRVIDNNTFTLRYLEDEAHRHYGPNVFTRCGAAKAGALPQTKTSAPPQIRGAEKAPIEVKKPAAKKKPLSTKKASQPKAQYEKLQQPTEDIVKSKQPEAEKAPVEEKKAE